MLSSRNSREISARDAVVQGALAQMRPVLMTCVVAGGGFFVVAVEGDIETRAVGAIGDVFGGDGEADLLIVGGGEVEGMDFGLLPFHFGEFSAMLFGAGLTSIVARPSRMFGTSAKSITRPAESATSISNLSRCAKACEAVSHSSS